MTQTPNAKLRVYAYQDPREFLRAQLDERKSNDSSFSVRKWASLMGMDGPELLAGLLSGKKRFRPRYLSFLRKGLGLDAMEELYFLTLILRKNAKDPEDAVVLNRLLESLSPGEGVRSKFCDDEEVFSDWGAMAILSALEIPELRSEERLLTALSGKIQPERALSLLRMLKDKELIRRSEDGFRPNQERLQSSTDRINWGSRRYYEQVLDLAKSAIPTALEQREFQFFSVTLSSEDVPAFKDMIREFRTKVEIRGLNASHPDVVYQMSIQFFPLLGTAAQAGDCQIRLEPSSASQQSN